MQAASQAFTGLVYKDSQLCAVSVYSSRVTMKLRRYRFDKATTKPQTNNLLKIISNTRRQKAMSRFEKISAIIAVIGLSIQFTGLCIQFTRSFDSLNLNTVQTPVIQTSSQTE